MTLAFEVACPNGHAYTIASSTLYRERHGRYVPRYCAWCPPAIPRTKPREGVPLVARRARGEAA